MTPNANILVLSVDMLIPISFIASNTSGFTPSTNIASALDETIFVMLIGEILGNLEPLRAFAT